MSGLGDLGWAQDRSENSTSWITVGDTDSNKHLPSKFACFPYLLFPEFQSFIHTLDPVPLFLLTTKKLVHKLHVPLPLVDMGEVRGPFKSSPLDLVDIAEERLLWEFLCIVWLRIDVKTWSPSFPPISLGKYAEAICMPSYHIN